MDVILYMTQNIEASHLITISAACR